MPIQKCEDEGESGFMCHPYVNPYREFSDNDFLADVDLCELHAEERVRRAHGRVRLEMRE